MRRPLCVFCAGTLGLELVCAFLPQTGRFVPFAAFFVASLLWALAGRLRKSPAWGYGICLILGAVLGLVLTGSTQAKWDAIQTAYDGRSVLLEAEVESTSSSYFPGRVRAVLRVETVDRGAASLRVECASLPACSPGDRVKGRFALEMPDDTSRLNALADGIALNAAYEKGFALLGQSTSFRARTARLQKRLSTALRQGMASGPAGVLAAMVTGDRTHLSKELRTAYRGAGLSHVLVVSGMHVSILCGDILSVLLPYRWEQSYRRRRRRTVWKSLLALVLIGVTGFTPSVRRAAVAVWVSALGVWVWGPPDALTSLAAAGILMTAVNSYAVWDIGFELSFAAVVGTVAGSACICRMRDAHDRRFWIKAGENLQKPVRRPWFNRLPERLQGFAESACIAACASAATFPVLVLRGLSVSAWAVVSSIAVLWMVQPLLLLGLAVAFVGLVPWLAPLHRVLSRAADLLTGLLNGWAVWLSTKPGGSIYFDTAYAALVCLLLCGLGVLAFRWRVRLRVALPGILLAAAVGIGLGNALSRDVVHIDLVGSAQAPAVVVTQNDRAVVLFRGGSAAQRAVENQLARRGVRTVELVADLRMNAKTACTLPAQQGIRAERLPVNTARKLRCTPAAVELLRTREGCLVRLSIGNRQFVTLSGRAELAQPLQTEWLIATPKKPETVQYQKLLALRRYSWMAPETQYTASLSLRRTGGEKLG